MNEFPSFEKPNEGDIFESKLNFNDGKPDEKPETWLENSLPPKRIDISLDEFRRLTPEQQAEVLENLNSQNVIS